MKLTNRSGFPDAICRAVAADRYTKGDSTYSVTELIGPARISVLKERHQGELTEDVEDRLWSLYGQVAHLILERANVKDLSEKRFYATIDGVRVSAQLDTLDLDSETLSDYKFQSSYKFKRNEPIEDDWVAQLNMQLEILRQNGMDAKKLQIIGLLRDYSKRQAQSDPDYPQASVVTREIPVWSREKTVEFFRHRIAVHKYAREILPECTEDERWAKPTMYAVMEKGKKRALKLHLYQKDAEAHAKEKPTLYVELRPGVSTRCENYCAVSKFCEQFKAMKQGDSE